MGRMAETKQDAEKAFDYFLVAYGAKYDEAIACMTKGRDVLPEGTWLLRRSPIDVTIGSPLVPEAQDWPEMVRLRDLARAAIARGAGEPLVDVGRG